MGLIKHSQDFKMMYREHKEWLIQVQTTFKVKKYSISPDKVFWVATKYQKVMKTKQQEAPFCKTPRLINIQLFIYKWK